MQPASRPTSRFSLLGWALGLGLVVVVEGCATAPDLAPPDPAVCIEAGIAAEAACPPGAGRSPECIDAALRAAVACRPRRAPVTGS